MITQVKYAGGKRTESSYRGPNPIIWTPMKFDQILTDPTAGWGFFDDFTGIDKVAEGRWVAGGDTGATFTTRDSSANATGAVAILGGDATDEDGYGFCTGQDLFKIDLTVPQKIAFEARIKVSDITNACSFALGFCDFDTAVGTLTTGDALADTTGAIGSALDDYFLGFHRQTGNTVDATYVTGGATPTAQADIFTIGSVSAYNSYGLLLDTEHDFCRWFVNGKLLHEITGVKANTAFPTGNAGFGFNIKQHTANAQTADIDWVQVAQLQPGGRLA